MATTAISSIDTQIAGLAPTLQTAIKATIAAESNSLKQTQTQKDTIDVRRSVFTDIKSNFDGLQNALQALISTQSTFGLNLVSKGSVTPGTAGTSVISAITTDNATPAEYDIVVTQLAKAQSKSTSVATSSDLALGKSGTFWLGGNGTSAVSLTPTDAVTTSSTSTVASGKLELGSGTYTLETRIPGGTRQFRLVNPDGSTVSILSQDGTTYTSDWQNMIDGSYDTGRGLNLTLNSAGSGTSTKLTYTAAGTSINISTTDSLRTITSAINAASQPEGRDFKASIVANKLVLNGVQTGENHSMIFTDGAGLGFGADLQAAQNAKFTVNGMDVSRAINTNLSDVVDGATLTLASDAAGKNAHLSIASVSDKAAGLMSSMVSSFNTVLSHLKSKLASVASTKDGKTTYTRGPISGDIGLSSFRLDMMGRMNKNFTNSGSLSKFSEIGLSFDKDMNLNLDSTKFSDALKNNRTNVLALLDKGLGEINSLVSSYAGSTGSLSKTLSSIDEQSKNYVSRIAKYNENLVKRKESLYKQYLGYQNQIVEYGYTAQWFGILNGTSTNGTNVNTSG